MRRSAVLTNANTGDSREDDALRQASEDEPTATWIDGDALPVIAEENRAPEERVAIEFFASSAHGCLHGHGQTSYGASHTDEDDHRAENNRHGDECGCLCLPSVKKGSGKAKREEQPCEDRRSPSMAFDTPVPQRGQDAQPKRDEDGEGF